MIAKANLSGGRNVGNVVGIMRLSPTGKKVFVSRYNMCATIQHVKQKEQQVFVFDTT